MNKIFRIKILEGLGLQNGIQFYNYTGVEFVLFFLMLLETGHTLIYSLLLNIYFLLLPDESPME